MTEKSSGALPGDAEADPVLVELGRRLLRARLRYGERLDPPKAVSQAAVARLIDVTGVTVGAWEAGKNDPGLSMLNKLAALYGVRLVWLLTGLGDMYDDEGQQGAPTNGTPTTDRPRRGSDIPIVEGDARKYAQEVTPDRSAHRKRRRRPPGDRTALAG